MKNGYTRFGLASGVAFALLQLLVLVFITASVLSNVPAPTAPAVERAAAFVEHADALRLGNYLIVLPVPFLLFFAAAAADLLHRRSNVGLGVPLLALVSAASMAMLWPLGGAISTIALLIAEGGGDATVVASLDAIAPYTLALSAVPRSTLIAALGVGLLAAGIGPRWIAHAGFGTAVLSFAGAAVLADDRLFPLLALSTLLFLVWMIVASVTMLRASSHVRGEAAESARAHATAEAGA